ncbi:MAG: hypothetical protein C5B55_05805 [Blastocatellia bacterium]|nr:MAG: hypothetical protein C5B55_05805 [Blastocatellia bacterium]
MLQNFLLELDGKAVGKFFGMSGGSAKAEIITVRSTNDSNPHKELGVITYEDIVLECGTGMSRSFYDWIGDSFAGKIIRKNGAVVYLDYNGNPKKRLEFRHALVDSLQLPALNHSGHEEAVMKVGLSPEISSVGNIDNSQKPGVYSASLPKAWNVGDFKLAIDGLDTSHVKQVNAISFGTKIARDSIGDERTSTNLPGVTSFSDLVIQIPGSSKTFEKWVNDFVIKGNSGSTNEKRGMLEYFAPKSNKAYFTIEFSGLGIYQFVVDKGFQPAGDYTVTMYCQSMKFQAGPAAVV